MKVPHVLAILVLLTSSLVTHGEQQTGQPVGQAGKTSTRPSGLSADAKSSEIAKRVRRFLATLGACDCNLSATDLEAGEKTMGKAEIKDLHGRAMSVSVMNDEYALSLFQEMTVQQKIPFGFPEDGCYARAHEMSYQLQKKGILTGKIFATGRFRLDNNKAARGSVSWVFHVAPFMIVDTGKSKMLWVIDPSLFYEPVPVEKWLETLYSHPKAELREVFLTRRFIYHPSHKDKVTEEFDQADLRSTRRLMKRYLEADKKRTSRALESM